MASSVTILAAALFAQTVGGRQGYSVTGTGWLGSTSAAVARIWCRWQQVVRSWFGVVVNANGVCIVELTTGSRRTIRSLRSAMMNYLYIVVHSTAT
jgi:hypothetical protein